MAATAEVDLSAHDVPTLKKFEETLLNYDQSNAEVQQNLALVRAEIAKKGGAPASAPTNGATQEAAPPSVAPAPEPTPPAPSVDRAALENQITFGIMRAHGIDPSDIPSMTNEQLQWVISHPGGNGAQESAPATPAPVTPPPAPQEQPETIETTRIVVPDPEPQAAPQATQASAPEPPQPAPQEIDAEREELESQVTGPMLKAFGRGRVDVPEIGINELRFMIQNPEGRVTQEQLLAARALDLGATVGEAIASATLAAAAEEKPPSTPEMVVTKEVLGPETEDHFFPQQQQAEAPAPTPEPSAPQRITKAQALSRELPANPAQEYIDREQFPVPPEIEGKPPRLPFDLSKCSDDELRSYHAQFHACHSRANYVVGLWEGELRDIVKLRKGAEVEAANNAPTKDPDDSRKRLTDAQREAWVAANPEVVAKKEREHEIERVLRQLRTLRDGYSSDVSTCSRQWSMRKGEADNAGGLR